MGGVNKVIYGGETIIDISDSTVTEDTLAKGVVGYGASGERIVGAAEVTADDVKTALGYTPVKSVNGKTGEAVSLSASDVGAVPVNAMLANNVTYHVNAVTGSDSNSGSSGSPFATLQKALSTIPNNLGGRSVVISLKSDIALATGEIVEIKNRYNGSISFSGDYTVTGDTSQSTKGIFSITDNAATIDMVGIRITQLGTAPCMYAFRNSGVIRLNYCVLNGPNGSGLAGTWFSAGALLNGLTTILFDYTTFNNCLGGAINATRSAAYVSSSCTINNCACALRADAGIIHGGATLNGNATDYATLNGGRIYTGAQASVPNY